MGSMPPAKPHVVCLGEPKYIGADYLSKFSKTHSFSVLAATDRATTIAELPTLVASKGPIDAFIIRMGTPPYQPFDAELLSALQPSCKIITSASAGFNEFDVNWMSEQGIVFFNSVDAVGEATADMAIFLLLTVLRNTSNAEKSVRSGAWRAGGGGALSPARDLSMGPSREHEEKRDLFTMGSRALYLSFGRMTLGIVGMGAIGKYLARKSAVFNLKIRYYNRNRLTVAEETKYNATYCCSLSELLSTSDIVSLNCPLNEQTTNLISTAEFALMKDGAFLSNTARGAVIDEAALREALTSGKVARAGLDVLCNEPDVDPWFFEQHNVILQPHLSELTDVSFRKAERECFENIRAYFETGKANSSVNLSSLK